MTEPAALSPTETARTADQPWLTETVAELAEDGEQTGSPPSREEAAALDRLLRRVRASLRHQVSWVSRSCSDRPRHPRQLSP